LGEKTVTGVTNANPAEVTTSTAHGLNAGDMILIFGTSPMDGLVAVHEVAAATSSTTFELLGFDSTLLAPYGATAVKVYGEGGAVYEIEMRKNIIGAAVPFAVNPGSNYFEPSVTGIYQGSTKATEEFFDNISKGKYVAIEIASNGLRQIYGKENGLEVAATGDLTYNSGPAASDIAGYTFTLTGAESRAFYLLDPAFALPVFTP
jgi:hypothetical protein